MGGLGCGSQRRVRVPAIVEKGRYGLRAFQQEAANLDAQGHATYALEQRGAESSTPCECPGKRRT